MLKKISHRPLFFRAAIFAVFFAVLFLLTSSALAQTDFGTSYAANVGLSTTDIRVSIVSVVRTILGILGILALLLVLYGGFVWMTAAGRADRIELAKKILLNAVIGLIIIIFAFAIVQYIFSVLTGGSSGGPGFVCTPGEIRGSCELCQSTFDGNGRWEWQYSWPGCSSIVPPNGSFSLNDVQTSHAGATDKDDVYWCSKVQNIFNHNINSTTVDGAHSDPSLISDPLRIQAAAAVADGTWDTRGNVLSFTPRGNEFANQSTSHSERLPTALEDTAGLFLSACSLTAGCEASPPPDFGWDFFVGADGDLVNPFITSTYPQSSDPLNPDLNVSLAPIIRIDLSESVDVNTVLDVNGLNPYPGNIYLYQLDGPGGSQVTQIDNSGLIVDFRGNWFTLRLADGNSLEPFAYYQLTVQNLVDLCGNPLDPSPYTWEFATNDSAPGISSYYPTGENSCPDTNISLTFNTSMYYNLVRMGINRLNPSGAVVDSWNYALPSGATSVADANGQFYILDAGLPESTHYTVYEFIPTNDLEENTEYNIYIETDRVIDSNLTPLTHSWNFFVTDLESCVCTPYISRLSPDQGPTGECLTISGQCFTGTVAQPATLDYIHFDNTPATIGAGYSSTAVGTSAPGGFNAGDRPQVSLAISYQSGNDVPPSNTREFLINPGVATGPCLWSIQPSSGARGMTGLRLLGDRLGDFDATRQVVFNPNAVFNVAVDDWTNQEITNVTVPMTAQDGEVVVVNDQGTSNGIYFDVAYCGDATINGGEQCDSYNLNGQTCSDLGWVGGILSCDASCQFDESACSNAPQVVQNSLCQLSCTGGTNDGSVCYSDDDCPGGGSCDINLLPSPNPYRNATNACLNLEVSADFNTDIDSATLNLTNIFIQQCLDSSCATLEPAHLEASLAIAGDRSFRLTPSSNLEMDTTYQVTLLGGPVGIASLDGNISMEDDYTWHFTTKNDPALCPIERVYVVPDDNTLGANQTDSSYYSSAVAPYLSTNCSLINGEDYDWEWSISQPNLGVSVIESLVDDSSATVLTGTEQGTVHVISATEGKEDSGNLTISFDSCSLTPGICEQTCPGSVCDLVQDRCTPVINSLSPNSGPAARWVTLQGCYFKSSRGSGGVDFGDIPVDVYPCGESWSDTEILVSVPTSTALSLGDYDVQVTDRYGLESNLANFNVIGECLSGVSVPPSGVPGLCSINPTSGMPGDNVNLSGENFGDSSDTVTFNGDAASINDWANQNINTTVPDTATDGEVVASVNSCPSNGLDFDVSSGTIGDPCDGDLSTPDLCDVDNGLCWSGLYCEPTSCTCRPVAAVNIIDASRYPAPATTVACSNTTISATFDQPMDSSTVDSGSIELWEIVRDADPNRTDCINTSSPTPVIILNEKEEPGLLARILSILKNFFKSSATAQATDIWYCPVRGSVSTHAVENGVANCSNPLGCTAFTFSPYSPLDAFRDHEIHILGGLSGVKSSLGGQLNTLAPVRDFIGDSYYWTFDTAQEICTIDSVDINVSFNVSGAIITREDTAYDYFTCAGRNNCPDDFSAAISGSQHEYFAQARDANHLPLTASYLWQEVDDDDLIQLSSPDTEQTNLVSPNPFNGDSTVIVDASDFNPDDGFDYGSDSAAVSVSNFMCQNPWPALSDFPYEDMANNCNLGSGSCFDMTFSTYYCRDYGSDYNYCQGGADDGLSCQSGDDCDGGSCLDSTSDDLLALAYPGNIRGRTSGYCLGGPDNGQSCLDDNACLFGHCYNVLKEFFFLYDDGSGASGWCSLTGLLCSTDSDCQPDEICQTNNDSIGIRAYSNGEHLSPSSWYQKYANQPGGYSTTQVDGYEAIASGRTTYINMAVDNPPLGSSPIYTNMFLLSYTDNFEPVTLNIHDQLLDNLKFNINGIDNAKMCTGGGYCEKDSDCPASETCDADKLKLTRDTIRLGALSEVIYHLDLYRGYCSAHDNLSCLQDSYCPDSTDVDNPEFCIIKNDSYPLLEAGTYLVGESVSVWDSWNDTFASLLGTSLLLDPLNEVLCNANDGYSEECWNKDKPLSERFQCNPGSHMYHYSVSGADSYSVYLNMEYANSGWLPAPTTGSFSTGFAQPCSPGSYNLMYSQY